MLPLELSEDFPSQVNNIILKILKAVGKSKFYYLFKNNPETLPLIANVVNKLAKEDSANWYDYKPLLVGEIIKRHSKSWMKKNDPEKIVYSETPYGQISFHTLNQKRNARPAFLPHSPAGRKFKSRQILKTSVSVLRILLPQSSFRKTESIFSRTAHFPGI